jgi:predicted nicotinamide N-methyase
MDSDDDDIPSNFFLSEDYVLYTEQISSFSQSFYALPSASTDYDLTGQVLWPGAKYLSQYLLIENPSLVREKIVLELGSGSGLCGLFVSQIAGQTILTDGNEVVMKLLGKNEEFGKNVKVALVDWASNDVGEGLRKLSLPEKFEILIGADVVYWSNSITPLFRTVDALMMDGGRFVMCYTLRAMNTYRDLLRETSDLGFKNQILWQVDNTYIFEFTRS